MPARIRAFCQRTGQPVPESKAAVVRCALESLALKYRWVLEKLEEIAGRKLEPLHIVGGGTQNRLLSQFAADATGRSVTAGPVEATALGNILMQAIAVGDIGSLAQGRQVIRILSSGSRMSRKSAPLGMRPIRDLSHFWKSIPIERK